MDRIEYVIDLWGRIPAKKNFYMPRKDRPGFFKHSALQTQLDRLALQVPAGMRDLKLEHPDVDFYFWMPDGRSDRDNCVTTLLDLLRTMGVIRNDAVAHFNGTVTVHPAWWDEEWKTEVILTPNPMNSFSKPKKPPEQLTAPRIKARIGKMVIAPPLALPAE